MDVFPKFIIEDDCIILAKVSFHRELITTESAESKVKGGGWFRFDPTTKTFVFYGESNDFGEAKFEDIKKCVEYGNVFGYEKYINYSEDHKFAYDTGTEIIEIERTLPKQ